MLIQAYLPSACSYSQLAERCLLKLQEPDTQVLSDIIEAAEEIIELAGPLLLEPAALGAVVDRLSGVLAASSERRAERAQRRQAEDFDAEEAEALEVQAAFVVNQWLFYMTMAYHVLSRKTLNFANLLNTVLNIHQ